LCSRCRKDDDELRLMGMYCGYDMNELNIPLKLEESEFVIRVCKTCRSQWLKAIKHWFENVEPKREVGSGIFIREFGDNVEITMEEWHEWRKKKAEEKYT